MKCTVIFGNTFFSHTPTPLDALNGCGWSNVYIAVQVVNTEGSDEGFEADTYSFRAVRLARTVFFILLNCNHAPATKIAQM
jgi:hypothetical protein